MILNFISATTTNFDPINVSSLTASSEILSNQIIINYTYQYISMISTRSSYESSIFLARSAQADCYIFLARSLLILFFLALRLLGQKYRLLLWIRWYLRFWRFLLWYSIELGMIYLLSIDFNYCTHYISF